MVGGLIEGGAAVLIALVGAAVIFGQIRENARANKEAIAEIKDMVERSQEETRNLIRENMQDMKNALNDQKEDQALALTHEIGHVKDTLAITINEIRDDIRRLEMNQNENAKLKEELIILRQSVKSLHKRLDIEIPESIKSHDYED